MPAAASSQPASSVLMSAIWRCSERVGCSAPVRDRRRQRRREQQVVALEEGRQRPRRELQRAHRGDMRPAPSVAPAHQAERVRGGLEVGFARRRLRRGEPGEVLDLRRASPPAMTVAKASAARRRPPPAPHPRRGGRASRAGAPWPRDRRCSRHAPGRGRERPARGRRCAAGPAARPPRRATAARGAARRRERRRRRRPSRRASRRCRAPRRVSTCSIAKPCHSSPNCAPVGVKPRLAAEEAAARRGMRIEPPPSPPLASGTMPATTAAAEPPLDPPGECVERPGLCVGPKASGSV